MPVYKDNLTNTWYYSFRKKINDSIINKKGRGYRTKIEAQKAEYEMIQKLSQASNTTQQELTINQVFDLYIQYASTKLKITTIVEIKQKYKNHIESTIGKYTLQTLTNEIIRKWKDKLVNQDFSETFTNANIRILKILIQFSLNRNYFNNNSLLLELEKVSLHKLIQERQIWSFEEIKLFLNTFNESLGTRVKDMREYFTALFYSGMRPNEFRCLQKKDIQGNYLSVYKNISSKIEKRKEIIITTKNKNSVRKVLMPEFIIDMLKDRTKDYKGDDFIFGKNKCFPETTIRRYLKKHAKLAKLPPLVVYGFRHSHATHLIRSGVSIKIVSKRLGHKDASTTMNVYWHLFKDDEEMALNALI